MIPKSTRGRWRALLAAATKGPWMTDELPRLAGAISATVAGFKRQVAHADGQAAMFDCERGLETHEVMAANAALIASAPDAMSQLLDEVERLQSLLDAANMRLRAAGCIEIDDTAITTEVEE